LTSIDKRVSWKHVYETAHINLSTCLKKYLNFRVLKRDLR